MPPEAPAVLLAVLGISLVSVVGALVLVARAEAVKRILPLMVALAAGALLGDTFLHLLPHSIAEFLPDGSTDVHTLEHALAPMGWAILAGLLGFFLIESVLHWHHHGEDVHEHGPDGVHSLGWMNLLGDFFHNFIDGMLIAAAWLVDPSVGVATAVAVLLHEVPQEFGDFGVLLHAGFSPKRALMMNLLSALAAVIGAVVVLLLPNSAGMAKWLTPIAAGGFLYIACADLVPELRRRAKGMQIVGTLVALSIGLGLMVLVHVFAHDHGHDHDHDHAHGHGHSHGHGSDHDDHDDHDHGHGHGDGDDHEGHDHGHGDEGDDEGDHEGHDHDDGDHGHEHGDGG